MDRQRLTVVPPVALGAEVAVLRYLLHEPSAVSDACAWLSSDDLVEPVCRALFSHLVECGDGGAPASQDTLEARLHRVEQQAAREECEQTPQDAKGLRHLCQRIRDVSLRRKLMDLCVQAIRLAEEEPEANVLLDRVETEIFSLCNQLPGTTAYSFPEFYEALADLPEETGEPSWPLLDTGIIDSCVNALRPGELTLLCGSTGAGPSTVLRQMACRYGQTTDASCYLIDGHASLRNLGQALLRACQASFATVEGDTLPSVWMRVEAPYRTFEEFAFDLRAIKAKHGVRLVLLDGLLQLPDIMSESDLGPTARAVKQIAQGLRVSIVATCLSDKTDPASPTLVDLPGGLLLRDAVDHALLVKRHATRWAWWKRNSKKLNEADLIYL